jgi:hypothetical protein
LQQLLRQRERVLKAAAKQRSTELLADFENQLGQIYSFDQDAVWKQAQTAAEAEIEKRMPVSPSNARSSVSPRNSPHL